MVRRLAVVAVLLCASLRAETYLILPFFNHTQNNNLDWIGESMAESIRDALANQGVLALDRDDRQEAFRRLSLKPYAELTRASILKVAETLDADLVISGRFEMIPATSGNSRGTLRVTAQILNTRRMTGGPEYLEVGPLEDLAKLQTHLAWQTLQFVIPKTAPSELEFRNRTPELKVEAIEHYIRGLLSKGTEQKLKLLQQAVRLEPKFSQANYQIGNINYEKTNYKAAAEYLSKVESNSPDYRQALFLLGLCRYHMDDFVGAEQSFQIVANAVPVNEVLNNLAASQLRQHRLKEALTNFEKALEGDTADPDYQFNVGYTYFQMGRMNEAADRFRAVLDRTPEDTETITMLGRSLKRSGGRPSTAARELERLKTEYRESAWMQLKAMLEPKK